MNARSLLVALTLSTATLVCSTGMALAAEYQLHYHVKGITPVTKPTLPEQAEAWSLARAALPRAIIGQPYSYSFYDLVAPAGLSGFSWSATQLPDWVSLDAATGQMAGTPSSADGGENTFTILAVREGTNDQVVYTIKVGDAVLEVTDIAAGSSHTCAVTLQGGAKCWGEGGNGRLGNGLTVSSETPVDVVGLGSGVATIEVGNAFSCAVTAAGAAKCWGQNAYGQLGNGTTDEKTTPVDVVGLGAGVRALDLGSFHACAVVDGAAKCWGRNSYGQAGTGATSTRAPLPAIVTGLDAGISDVTTGGNHSCAITTAGQAFCWGYNTSYQLGDGTNTNHPAPVAVKNIASVSQISAGFQHTCAVAAGAAKCWGNGGLGRLGNGGNSPSSTPTDVSGLSSGVVKVSAGDYHSCAVTTEGTALCWGDNRSGQLGDGTTTQSPYPRPVAGFSQGTTRISAGSEHTCGITAREAKCWGAGSVGQLGNGDTSARLVPSEVTPGL